MHRFADETIHIENLHVKCIIGVNPHERERPQTLIVTASFPWEFGPAEQGESLGKTVDYAEVAQAIRAFAQAGEYRLLETLARRMASHVGERFGLARLALHVRKPEAIAESDGAAVSLTWHRDGAPRP